MIRIFLCTLVLVASFILVSAQTSNVNNGGRSKGERKERHEARKARKDNGGSTNTSTSGSGSYPSGNGNGNNGTGAGAPGTLK